MRKVPLSRASELHTLRSATRSTKSARWSTGRPSVASQVESVHNMSVHSQAFVVDSFSPGFADGFEAAFVTSDDDSLSGLAVCPIVTSFTATDGR